MNRYPLYKIESMSKPFHLHVFILFLTLSGYCINAQQEDHHSIKWAEQRSSQAGSIPSFKNAVYDYERPNVLKYCNTRKVNSRGVYDVVLTNIRYEAVSNTEQRLLKSENLDAQPRVEVGFGEHKGNFEVSYCFAPYVRQNGIVKKVSGFDARVVTSAAPAKGKRSSVQAFKNNSVLSTGDWFKFSITSDGMFKLTPADLTDAGIKLDNTPLSSIRVMGNGQGILPAANDAPRKDDLQEIPLKVVDNNSNGIFDGSDYALFYAKGPHTWAYNQNSGSFNHTLNFYRDANFYFVSVNSGVGKRIAEQPGKPGVAGTTITTYDDYQFKEDELENLVGAGREWMGDVFDFDLNNNYGFNFPDLVRSQPIKIRVRAVGRAGTDNTFMNVLYNDTSRMLLNFPAYIKTDGANFVQVADNTTSFRSRADNFSLNLRYNNSANPTGVAWLDFIEVQVRRNLIYRNNALVFREVSTVGAGNVTEFVISNANAQLEVWDVSDINKAFAIQGQLNGTNLSVKVGTDSLREFVTFRGNSFPAPEFKGKVENQDLHALSPAEMVIVVHPNFLEAAERLATFHLEQDNMKVEVVTVDQIYNEFSSGGQDITAIRDFMRMLYTRNNGSASDLRFLCLMGDASYDYRDRLSNNSNYVPIWQHPNSFSLQASAVSDDYYGYLDPSEGGSISSGILDIGIGRIPCGSLGQAQVFVDKVIHYTTGSNRFGDWRNKILLMADDRDQIWESKFVTFSESLENIAKGSSNAFNVEKIYADSYKQVSTSGSESYPEASSDMFRKIQQGNLVTNYIGHGGEIGLASEKLLQLSDVNGWTNYDAMPLFLTITCEFTRLDDPKRVSAGEQLLLNPNGGAISLVSTTRVVDVESASALNGNIFDSLLTRPDNFPKRLGDIIKDAKNGNDLRNTFNRLKFSLFGDPSMRLAIPFFRVQTNEVNGKAVASGSLDTLQALSRVTIKGQVNDLNNQKLSDFTGVLNVSVFDKPNERETLANDGVGSPINFKLQSSLIYRGKVDVKNGDFNIEFLVPLDIAYQFGFGKISYYATNSDLDAAGVFDTIIIGGFNNNAPEDNVGPEVRLFINDESFVRGGITDANPELYAVISDSSGVNTVGNGVGHDLVAVLDNKTDQSYVVNEYYEADLNSYQSGSVRYPFYDLEDGTHTLKLKVFDVYNNFAEAETDFVVAEDEDLALEHVLNYPNPFTTYTEFQFEHNRANQPLDIQVQIFTVSGKLVKTINASRMPTGNRITGIAWNGLDDYGDKIGKGVYVYRVKVRTQNDNALAEKYEKLVILR